MFSRVCGQAGHPTLSLGIEMKVYEYTRTLSTSAHVTSRSTVPLSGELHVERTVYNSDMAWQVFLSRNHPLSTGRASLVYLRMTDSTPCTGTVRFPAID